MTPWLRTTAWLAFWATLLVALVVGAFVAWLLTEVLPPGTVISVDGERFVLRAFTEPGHWLLAALGVLVVSLVIVAVIPIVTVLAIVVPVAVGSLGLLVGMLALGLVLWPLWLLARWLWKSVRKPTTIAA
jgi:protein-S-isoprenylcysteine O-methyltransferase Ste14